MLNRVTIRVASFVCVMVAAGSAFGQAAGFPYKGEINGTSVRVRAGRGDPSGANNYYYCTVLNSPATVTVVGAEKGWLMVMPPEGCYSVVLASAVRPDATGTKGTMIKREWARAAGTVRTAQFTAGQAILKAGATVEIIGSVVDRFKFYKIKSPRSVRFWIYATYVDKVGSLSPGGTSAVGGAKATTRPATGTSGGTSGTTAATNKTAPKPVGVTSDEMAEFKTVLAALRKEYGKPVVERDYGGIIERFQALKLEKDHPLVPFVKYYVKYIEADMERLAGIVAARKLTTDAADAQREFDAARANVTITIPPKPKTFAADGIVGESRMFTGTSAVRKRYILYVNKTHCLNAYIYSTDPQIDLPGLIGKHIGVYGETKFDSGLGSKIINVNRVEIINDQVGVPALDKPVVRAVPHKPKPSATPISPLVIPKATPATGAGGTSKPMPLTDLVPKVKPADVNRTAPVVVPDGAKPAPVVKPVPVPPKTGTVGTVNGKQIEVFAPLPPGAAKPAPVEVAKPIPVEIAKPAPVEIAKPAPVEVAKPAPVEVTKPIPVEIAKPAPIEVAKPAPVELIKPAPVEVAKPAPVEIAKPKPIELTLPTPVEVAKPAPIEIAKPAPVEIAKPKPIELTQPTPVEIAKPKPIDKPIPVEIAKPAPIEVAKPAPIELIKPAPVEIAKPKPIELTQPTPVEIAKPIPVEIVKPSTGVKPAPVGVTSSKPAAGVKPLVAGKPKPITDVEGATKELGKLIDLESIGKTPATRPARSLQDAIPAPTKKVNPSDFPMPLPPSGLPLLDVKKTPTTVPVDTSEFD